MFPSTSHEALGLATVATYRERLQQPMVYIVYSESTGFVVHWHRAQADEERAETVPSPQAPEVFERILDWLRVAKLTLAEPKDAGDRV